MALSETEPGAGSLAIRLGERYDILPGTPVEEFRSPTADAYRVIDRDHPGDLMFALICASDVPPRWALLDPLSSLHSDALVKPVRWGVVDWPPLGQRALAIVFAQPAGRIVASLAEPFPALGEDEIITLVLPPVMAGLKSLFDLGITHRAIRPTNLFRRRADRRILLGECVSAPPAAAQPAAFESIESSFAMPSGRGAGSPADDLYALGVTLLCLTLGDDPTREVDPRDLLDAKIARGSFTALQSLTSQPPKLLEPIRGLLADNPRERWALQDLDSWVQRRRVTVRQSGALKRAPRPFEAGGQSHVTARSLACVFVREPASVILPVASGELETWLLRSLGDSERSAALSLATADGGGADGPAREARLAARVAMALDPAAPVRFAGIAAAVDGFGAALAETFRSGDSGGTIAEAIMARLPQFWFSVQRTFRSDHAPLLKSFDRMRMLLEDRRPGFGLTRVLYELNPGLHCLSPAIERAHVIEARELFPALERAAAAGQLPEPMIDRHVAAFVAARCKTGRTDWLEELASGNPQSRALGTLKLLAYLQGLGSWTKAPTLGDRMAKEVPPLIGRYHSRARRARVTAALTKLGGSGNLVALLSLAVDLAEKERDDSEFRAARLEFAAISQEIASLNESAEMRAEEARVVGGTLAGLAAMGLGAVAALVCLVIGG